MKNYLTTDLDLYVKFDLVLSDTDLTPSDYYLEHVYNYEHFETDPEKTQEKLEEDIFEIFDGYIYRKFLQTFPIHVVEEAETDIPKIKEYRYFIQKQFGSDVRCVYVEPKDPNFIGLFYGRKLNFKSIYLLEIFEEKPQNIKLQEYNKSFVNYLLQNFKNYFDSLTLRMFKEEADIILNFINDNRISIEFYIQDLSHHDYVGTKDDFAQIVFYKNKEPKLLMNY